MKETFCKNCIHFCQHYRLEGLWFIPVRCGHCTGPHGTVRKPDSPGCERFCSAVAGENVVPFPGPRLKKE